MNEHQSGEIDIDDMSYDLAVCCRGLPMKGTVKHFDDCVGSHWGNADSGLHKFMLSLLIWEL